MNKNVLLYSLLLIQFIIVNPSLAQTQISNQDFASLAGNWSGSLTYLNYSSDDLYTLPAELKVVNDKKADKVIFYISFPEEPHANTIDTLSISEDGTLLEGEHVISKNKLDNGSLEIVTEITGTDGNDDKLAVIKHIYAIGHKNFLLQKKVRFIEGGDWITRNEFNFIKDPESK